MGLINLSLSCARRYLLLCLDSLVSGLFLRSHLLHLTSRPAPLWSSAMSQSADSAEAIITSFVDEIHDPFTFVSVITPLCACLVTLLVVLFVFSTRELRRRLIFRLNVIAICFALALGVLNFIVSGSAILRPFKPVSQSLYTATIVAAVFPPVFYDSILLTRLLALYPVDRTPLPTLIGILTFPVCVKCARLTVLSLYIRQYIGSSPDLATLTAHAQATWFRNPYVTAEWTLQMFDNLYSSGLFLYQLHTQSSGMSIVKSSGSPIFSCIEFTHGISVGSYTYSLPGVGTIGRRIRQIFYISGANFVFPVMFNIGQIICITTDSSYYIGTMLLLSNTYVSVIGVLCATIWVSGGDYVRRHSQQSPLEAPIRFTPGKRRIISTDSVDGGGIGSGKHMKKRSDFTETDVDLGDLEMASEGLSSGQYPSMYSNTEVFVKHDIEHA
ncbi:hypothetical protein J3A83DRAFT_1504525 [Scleroderma citrinum]